MNRNLIEPMVFFLRMLLVGYVKPFVMIIMFVNRRYFNQADY